MTCLRSAYRHLNKVSRIYRGVCLQPASALLSWRRSSASPCILSIEGGSMSKQLTKSEQIAALEERVKQLEDRIAFQEKTLQEHSHNINDETIAAIVAYVKQDIVNTLVPPAPQAQPAIEEKEQEQAG